MDPEKKTAMEETSAANAPALNCNERRWYGNGTIRESLPSSTSILAVCELNRMMVEERRSRSLFLAERRLGSMPQGTKETL